MTYTGGYRIIITTLLLVAFGIGTVSALTWQIETVDSAGNTGFHTSLALDSNGNPRISYSDQTSVKYAAYNGATWNILTVVGGGDYSSLVLDRAGSPHISYYDWTNKLLKYATGYGSSWATQTGDYHAGGLSTSLALDNAGNPRISYQDDTNRDLKYAAYYGSSWWTQTVDPAGDVGDISSLALDSTGNPHISYFDTTNDNLKYAAWTGSNWQIVTVDTGGGQYNSLALDSAGNPHISYSDNTNGKLKYATWTGSKWQIVTVDTGGQYNSLALDSAGNPQISYYDYTNSTLKYAAWSGSAWQIVTVDTGGGRDTSLKLDSAGNPRISYIDWTNKDLKYARGIPSPVPTPTPPAPGSPSSPSGCGSSSTAGCIYVASIPSNATIFINGIERGSTNQVVTNVTAGSVNLTLMKDGYTPYTTIFSVPVGDLKALAPITLTKGESPVLPGGTGSLYITSYPTNATILIEGVDRGRTNQFVHNIPAGNMNLTLTKSGYYTYTAVVSVPSGETTVLAPFTLVKSSMAGDMFDLQL
jgi:hypothetical protein